MSGPAPKDPAFRARTNVPERGEWLDLPTLSRSVLPGLPRRARGDGPWSSRTRRMWRGWKADWATGRFGASEIAMTVELAFLFEDAVRASKPAMWAETRQWMDRLGLTLKGKRDLRLRLAEPPAPTERPKEAKRGSSLRLVDDDAVSA